MGGENHVADANVSESTKVVEVGSVNTSDSSEYVTKVCDFMLKESFQRREAIDSQESTLDLSNEPYVYREDVVRCKKPGGLVGIVSEVAGDLDSDSSMTDYEDDNDDDNDAEDSGCGDDVVDDGAGNNNDGGGIEMNDALQDGQVRVIWLDHSETVCNISDITVVDRSFLHGDIVADVSNPTGQLGVVVDVNITIDLQAADGEVIKGVPSRHLQCIRDFTVGDYVVFGHWLGRVDEVLDNVTVLFDDGSTCKVMKADPSRLKPVSKDFLQDARFPYYPGQRIRASSSSVFKNARWLSGLWKANRLEGTVIKVQTGSVFIYWVASASPSYGSGASSVPSEEQKPMNLLPLSCFAHANWQLGDWCMLPSLPPVGEAFSNDKYENSSNACVSQIKQAGECSDKENSDIDVISCAEGLLALRNCETFQYKNNETEDLKSTGAQEKLDGNCESSHHECSMDVDDGNCVCDTGANNETSKTDHLTASVSCSSSSSVSKEPMHESWPIHRKKMRKVLVRRDRKAWRKGETFERALLIVHTMTKVDVVWQDGTMEFGRDSKSLIPVNSPGDHEFCPEQYVVEKPSSDVGDDSSEVRRVGVVKSVNAKERTACVRWLKPVARPEDPREFDKEEVVSVYELDEHPDYDYCYGDVVVRLSPVPVAGDTTSLRHPTDEQVQHAVVVQANGSLGSRTNTGSKIVEHKSNDDTDVNFSGLSWVGNITGLQDGDIEVTWADGMVSKVGPQSIYVVGRDDDESVGGSEVSDGDAASWETVEEHERDALENAEESATGNNSDMAQGSSVHSEENNPAQNGPLSFPLAALGFVTRLASGLFNRGRKQLDQLALDSNNASESGLLQAFDESGTVGDGCTSQESNAADDLNENATRETTDACEDVMDHRGADAKLVEDRGGQLSEESDDIGKRASYEDDCSSFKRFDITKDPVDNYYFGGNGQNINGGRKWVKKVQQDWSILEKNLPDGIYVRVYEDRMDLLRAVIVGAYGTPYQDGLFFFDFHLPPEYPQVPLSAYYHSGGLRLNPNLYEDGKVCLSLLNTWTGKGNEVWDPSSSSILQVLVSLQGLVLNSRPYFNEAGYDKQVGTAEGEKNSVSYNENTFLLNCKSMLYLLRRPPMHFEEFVRQHFQRRGYYILKACDAYMKGCLVGSLTKDACRSNRSTKSSNSVGFKLMLGKIMPKLVTALSEVGADCKQFEHFQ